MWQCAFIWLIRTMVSFQCARPSHLEDQDSKSQGLSCPVGGLSSGEDGLGPQSLSLLVSLVLIATKNHILQ